MASLSVQTLKHLTLEQILSVGFDRLPNTKEFYCAILDKIDPEIKDYYEEADRSTFERDLLFIVNNEGNPINCLATSFYWRRVDQKYLLVWSGDWIEFVYLKYFDSLESLLAKMYHDIIVDYASFDKGVVGGSLDIPFDFRPILEVMYSQKEQEILALEEKLANGSYIKITAELVNLSLSPLTVTSDAIVILDNNELIIAGVKILKKEEKDLGDESLEYLQPYAVKVSGGDIHRILAIFTYNKDSYELLK